MDAETRAEVISIINDFKETKIPALPPSSRMYYGGFGEDQRRTVSALAVEALLDKILGLLGADDKPALNL